MGNGGVNLHNTRLFDITHLLTPYAYRVMMYDVAPVTVTEALGTPPTTASNAVSGGTDIFMPFTLKTPVLEASVLNMPTREIGCAKVTTPPTASSCVFCSCIAISATCTIAGLSDVKRGLPSWSYKRTLIPPCFPSRISKSSVVPSTLYEGAGIPPTLGIAINASPRFQAD